MKNLVWHYTTGEKFQLIARTGVLLPATANVPPGEKPILWFSAHPYFEPTARKAVHMCGGIHILDVPELYSRGGGLVRFGLQESSLMGWENLNKVSGMGRAQCRSLEAAGRRQGANPNDWHGCFDPVPLGSCAVEVMDENLKWVRVADAALPTT